MRKLIIIAILLTLSGCSSSQKNKGATSDSTSSFLDSTRQVKQDFATTEKDLNKMASAVDASK